MTPTHIFPRGKHQVRNRRRRTRLPSNMRRRVKAIQRRQVWEGQ